LSSDKAIVVYTNDGTDGYGKAVCASLSGTTVTMGSSVTFEAADLSDVGKVVAMDSTHAIVAYADSGNLSYGTACCLTLSGTTVTAGSPVVFFNNSVYPISIAMMDSSHAILLFSDNNDNVCTVCLTLTDTTISYGSVLTLEGTANSNGAGVVIRLSATEALVFYGATVSDPYDMFCRVLTLDGTTVTAGDATTVVEATGGGAGVFNIAGGAIDASNAVVAYSANSTNITPGNYARVITLS
jgi:hypothetical protein